MSVTPIRFEADYVEQRSRLTTFFRLILAIPHLIVMTVWGFFAMFAVFFAWFAIVFTGRWPAGLYSFTAGFMKYSTAAGGYMYLLTDEYPPFSGDTDRYPVRLVIGERKAQYSRMKTLFRFILVIPVYIIAYAMGVVAQVGALIAWFAIVILGKQPRGLQEMTELGLGYQQRGYAYMLLLDDEFPSFSNTPRELEPGTGARADLAGPATAGSFAPPVAPDPGQAPPRAAGEDPPPPYDPFGREQDR